MPAIREPSGKSSRGLRSTPIMAIPRTPRSFLINRRPHNVPGKNRNNNHSPTPFAISVSLAHRSLRTPRHLQLILLYSVEHKERKKNPFLPSSRTYHRTPPPPKGIHQGTRSSINAPFPSFLSHESDLMHLMISCKPPSPHCCGRRPQ